MNGNGFLQYPVWNLDFFGGGFWIAAIAVIHVYIAHFAVGGGLFLVLTEWKAHRENSESLLDFTKTHARFFLILTAVFGALTGVGIWFVISLLSPAATSVLIRQFVFGWATEWTFFLGEIITLFVYYYTFGKLSPRRHLQVGWIYFLFAWLSLVVINGIISYMLTPGDWLITRNFWDGMINPSFVPSTMFRTAVCVILAGLFACITALRLEDAALQTRLFRYCAVWMAAGVVVALFSGQWFVSALPTAQKSMLLNVSPESIRYYQAFLWCAPILFLLGIFMAVKAPLPTKQIAVGLLLAIGFAYLGAFEYIRESARRPYLIHDYLYSTGLLKSDLKGAQQAGVLSGTRFSPVSDARGGDPIETGQVLFRFLCSGCHSIGGPMNDILPLTAKYTSFGMDAFLSGMGTINRYMPPFAGNRQERAVLADYIVKGLHGRQPEPPAEITQKDEPLPAFNAEKDAYLLVAWSKKGMHCLSDADRYFSFMAPGNDIHALLIRRGPLPERVSEGVTVTYQLDEPFRNPAAQVDFWKYSADLTGAEVPENTGLSGLKPEGEMTWEDDGGAFAARGVPAVPYRSDGAFFPYPMMTVEARDASGKILATTRISVPVSTEMGCRQCHGGPWRKDGAGISDATAEDILTVHDRINRTQLLETARSDGPFTCQSCHGEDPSRLNLSAAVHGFHADYLSNRGAQACAACHPGHPDGATHAYRGIHREIGLDCTNCHGPMEDHAISLLKAEAADGKKRAAFHLERLTPALTATAEDIKPRRSWVQEPDCLTCHVDFSPPETGEAFNHWTGSENELYRSRTGEGGAVRCAACHGAPHAIYPADNPYGAGRDSVPPLQYQNNPYPLGANKNCRACHTMDMEMEMHHPNSLAMFRNAR